MCILPHSFHELVVVLLARFLRNTILHCAALNWLTNSSKFDAHVIGQRRKMYLNFRIQFIRCPWRDPHKVSILESLSP